MNINSDDRNKEISIAVTTYNGQSYYTHACLESIRKWKTNRHELIVACHDQTTLLESYLIECKNEGLIDKLIFTPNNYGHTQGVNKCFENASGKYFVNIANDICIGPIIVDDCVYKLKNEKIGIIGWHWYSNGTFWDNGKIKDYKLRDEKKPFLEERDLNNIKNAKWFTGKLFNDIGPKWIHLCNTAFFVIRKELWNKIGGFGTEYKHYWADDFLNYAILDQELSISAFDTKYKTKPYFHEFQYSNTDVNDRHRDLDYIPIPEDIEDFCANILDGGLSKRERSFIYNMSKNIPNSSTILHVGLWRGASLALSMHALRNKKCQFIGIDCFDMPNISQLSGQPPTTKEEVENYLESFLNSNQQLELIKANTLELKEFPKSDFIFIDAGHTKECVENDSNLADAAINKKGLLLYHDYKQPAWKDVSTVLDKRYGSRLKNYETIAIIKND